MGREEQTLCRGACVSPSAFLSHYKSLYFGSTLLARNGAERFVYVVSCEPLSSPRGYRCCPHSRGVETAPGEVKKRAQGQSFQCWT